MKTLFAFLMCLLFLNYGCNLDWEIVQPFETTVQVIDMDGKPMKGQSIVLTTGYATLDTTTKMTDNEGKATFLYSLSMSESHAQTARFVVKDSGVWLAVNSESHSLINRQKKLIQQNFQINMDTLKPFQIRLKSDRADVKVLTATVDAYLDFRQTPKAIRRYMGSCVTKTSNDTVFTVKAFSKANFGIVSYPSFGSIITPLALTKQILIDDKVNRNSIFLINH
jgi:hypothetical protein